MSNVITPAREALATALAGTGYLLYRAPKENMSPPCLVLVPANPYIELKTVGGRLNGSYMLTLCVALNDNEAALINLEKLICEVVDVLPAGIAIGTFSAPSKSQVGPTDLLTTDVQIDITIS